MKDIGVKKIKSKGIAPAAALFFVAIMIFFEGIFLVNFVEKTGDTIRVVRETEIITAINGMEAVKRGLTDAIAYSTYKASKDVLDTGGFCVYDNLESDSAYCEEECKIEKSVPTYECVPWWRIYSETYAPDTWVFKRYLENRIAQKFNEYANSFAFDGVETPEYCPRPPGVVTMIPTDADGNPQLYIRLTSITGDKRNRMTYSGRFFDITDNATFSDMIDVKTIKIFERGRSLFVESDSIRGAFNTAESSMPSECRDIYLGDVCKNEIDCSSELSTHCGDGNSIYKNKAEKNIEDIGGVVDSIQTKVELRGCMEAEHDTDITYSEKVEDYSGCDCITWVTDCDGTATPCESLTNSDCEAQDGCTWNTNCDGTPSPCETYSGDQEECEKHGCGYREETGECYGGPKECYAYNTEEDCTGAGCDWSAECTGTTTSCDSFDKTCSKANKADCTEANTKCNVQSGCSGTMTCEERYDLYKELHCTYDYYGSANVSVEIKDIENKYPIGLSWEELSMRFYAVSGNGGTACKAATTEDSECKTE